MDPSENDVPSFLQSFENLTGHFDEHFGPLGSNPRGDTFLALAEKIIPLMDEFSDFPQPKPSAKKSHDGGVDLLTSEPRDGRILCAQSKYKIRDKAEFDTIISKFRNYESSILPPQAEPDLFEVDDSVSFGAPIAHFSIVTSSKLDGIKDRYERSTLTSNEYYETLKQQNRLTIIDGPRILLKLQQLYRKSHLIPSNIKLVSQAGWISFGNVYVGAIQGKALVELYAKHGDALFFENVRDFLGAYSGRVYTTRSSVNQEIIATIQGAPQQMLGRNNGVTLRATDVVSDSDGNLDLKKAAIVNGCQTTMCLVYASNIDEKCFVPAKVVVTEDAWDIAKAANYQNPVTRVDLDLARYLRPQLVRRVAARLGYAVTTDSESSASSVLNSIYQTRVDYEELRLLYLGLFSRKPNNVFEAHYAELRIGVLHGLYEEAESEEQIFTVMLLLLRQCRSSLDYCREKMSSSEYAALFQRFFKDDKPSYRSLLAVVAACAAVRDDISSRKASDKEEISRMRRFLGTCRKTIENTPDIYRSCYLYAFNVIADALLDIDEGKHDADIQQSMYNKVSKMSFESLYKRVLMRLDTA